VQFIAVAQNLPGTTVSSVKSYIETRGWSIPVGVDDAIEQVLNRYGETRDTFIVLDTELKVAYRRGYSSNTPEVTFPQVIAKVNEILLTPVESVTWGRLKRLFP
jgi:hypothetical protein